MESKELRIGNWVMLGNDYKKVCNIYGEDSIDVAIWPEPVICEWTKDIKPILLTPEILLKAGFEFSHETDEYAHYKTKNNLYISYAKVDIPFGFNDKKACWYIGDNHTEIPNLHWLQNLVYFTYKFDLTIIL